MNRVDATLARLSGLYPRAIDLSLGRMRHLLARLGHPETSLPPHIHVAGTNGKGSTIATMRAVAEAAGMRVHAYTSPHLVRFNERIRLAGALIEDDPLVDLLEEIERRNDGTPITFFEITTAAAFLAFSRVPADLLLLETGLGGRLDATNVVVRPEVSVITPIGFDHMHFLGDTIPLIAGEKAGIIKSRRPAVIGRQSPEALAVLEAEASGLAAPLLKQGNDWQAEPTAHGWRYDGPHWAFDLPLPRLAGLHQIDNAGGALAALEAFDHWRFDLATIRRGLAAIDWPARMQRLMRGPLAELLPPPHELWLDGAHNSHAAAMLAAQADSWSDRPLHVVVGLLNNRDVAEFLRPWANHIATLQAVTIPGSENAHTADDITAAARSLGVTASSAPSVGAALALINATNPVRMLICGSLYLAGSVLAENG